MKRPTTDLHASITHSKTSRVVENMEGARTTSREWAGLTCQTIDCVNSDTVFAFNGPLVENYRTWRVKEDVAYW
jgi:hypothetical protein